MKASKVLTFSICFLVILLGIFVGRLAQEKKRVVFKDSDVVLKNDGFLLTREQVLGYHKYHIYFNEISASDTILNLKRIIEYCARAENGNPYSIYFSMGDTERLNCVFLEGLNKRKRLSQEDMYESFKTLGRYKGFLRKHLCMIGCVLDDSTLFTMEDAGCYENENKELYLSGEVCIYFNWQKISNAAVSDETM